MASFLIDNLKWAKSSLNGEFLLVEITSDIRISRRVSSGDSLCKQSGSTRTQRQQKQFWIGPREATSKRWKREFQRAHWMSNYAELVLFAFCWCVTLNYSRQPGTVDIQKDRKFLFSFYYCMSRWLRFRAMWSSERRKKCVAPVGNSQLPQSPEKANEKQLRLSDSN